MQNTESTTFNSENLFQDNCRQGYDMLNTPDNIGDLLKRLESKLRGIPQLGEALACIPQMGMLINSYIRKEYTAVPVGIIAAIIGVLIYFVSPIDLMPDFIPGIGLIDDAFAATSALCLVKSDLDEYMKWRQQSGSNDNAPVAG